MFLAGCNRSWQSFNEMSCAGRRKPNHNVEKKKGEEEEEEEGAPSGFSTMGPVMLRHTCVASA